MHPNQLAFQQGVHYLFDLWPALILAIQHDWSNDGLGLEKRAWFEQTIVDYFDSKGKRIDEDEMEEILAQIMSDEFNTLLEDDSAYMVAKQLVELFKQVTNNDHSMVQSLRDKVALKGQQPSLQAATANDQSSSSDSEDDEEMQN